MVNELFNELLIQLSRSTELSTFWFAAAILSSVFLEVFFGITHNPCRYNALSFFTAGILFAGAASTVRVSRIFRLSSCVST